MTTQTWRVQRRTIARPHLLQTRILGVYGWCKEISSALGERRRGQAAAKEGQNAIPFGPELSDGFMGVRAASVSADGRPTRLLLLEGTPPRVVFRRTKRDEDHVTPREAHLTAETADTGVTPK